MPFLKRKKKAPTHKDPVTLAPAYREMSHEIRGELEDLGVITSRKRLSRRDKKRATALLAAAKSKAINKLLHEYDLINVTHDAMMQSGREAWPELQLSNPLPSQSQRTLFKERFGHRPNPKITDLLFAEEEGRPVTRTIRGRIITVPINAQLSMNSVHNTIAANQLLSTVPGIETGSLVMPDHIVPTATIHGQRFVMDSRLGGDKAVLTEEEYRKELKRARGTDVHILNDVATRMASDGRLTDADLEAHMSYSPGNAAAWMALHTEWGRRHYANHDYTRASYHARRAAEVFPHSAEAWTNLGETLMSQGGAMMAGIKEDTGRRALWEAGGFVDPKDHPKWDEAQGLHRDAVSAFSRALKINPNSVNAIEGKGYSLFHLGYETAARDHFRRARQMRITRDKAAILREIEERVGKEKK